MAARKQEAPEVLGIAPVFKDGPIELQHDQEGMAALGDEVEAQVRQELKDRRAETARRRGLRVGQLREVVGERRWGPVVVAGEEKLRCTVQGHLEVDVFTEDDEE